MKKAFALLLLVGVVISLACYFLYAPQKGQTVDDWAGTFGQDDPAPSPPAPEPPVVTPPPLPPPSPEPAQPGPKREPEPTEPPAAPVSPPPIERPMPPAAPPVRLLAQPSSEAAPIRQRARDAEAEFQMVYAKLTAAQAKSDDKEKKTCCSTGNQ